MSQYQAPLADMRFVMNELAGLDAIATLPGYEGASADHCLTHAPGLRDTVTGGAESVLAFAAEAF